MQKIDLDAIFKGKNPQLYKWIPRLIMSYLKRIVHQKEINEFIEENDHLSGNDFTQAVLKTLNITYSVEFLTEIPKDGRYIFASNHPLGGADGIILIDYFSRYFSNILFPVNDLLLNLNNVKQFFIPINKHGQQSRESAQSMNEAFASDKQILFFPAGLVSRRQNGKIKDTEWKKNFIQRATKYERDIIPVHISGRNSNFFYNLANIRKKLGIKSNIEMLYLSDELFKHRNKKIKVTVGKPIPHTTFNDTKTTNQWAEYVKQKVYSLEEK